MTPDLPRLSAAPPTVTHPGPCAVCGAGGAMYGVVRRATLAGLRGVLPAPPGAGPRPLALFADDPPPRRGKPVRDPAYLPLYPEPEEEPPEPPAPVLALCHAHTVAVVLVLRSWGEDVDGYDWVGEGLLTTPTEPDVLP